MHVRPIKGLLNKKIDECQKTFSSDDCFIIKILVLTSCRRILNIENFEKRKKEKCRINVYYNDCVQNNCNSK
jgi:hypothetical protein